MTRLGVAVGVALLTGCAGVGGPTPAADQAIPWVLFTMYHPPSGGEHSWTPVQTYASAERCRGVLREKSERGPLAPVGLIAWYPVPGNPGYWVGCLPFGYDPYERR